MAAMAERVAPPGFFFLPSPEELVQYYLRNFAAGLHIGPDTGGGFVWECGDVFSTPPEVLTTRYPAANPDGCWFFLTRRKPRVRAVPNAGSWRVYRGKRALIGSGGKKVSGAYHQNLEYMVGDKKNAERTGWLMEEFGLDCGCGSDGLEPVLCTLHRSARTIKKRPPPEASSSSPVQESKKARFEEPPLSGVLEMGAEPAVLPSVEDTAGLPPLGGVLEMGAEPAVLPSVEDTAGLPPLGVVLEMDFDALFGDLDWTTADPIISPAMLPSSAEIYNYCHQ